MVRKETVNKKEILERIVPIIEKVADQLGLIILEVSFVKEAGRWFVRIFIYSHEHPVSHQDCEKLTREVDDYLDQLIPVPYYLEVSSPGLERKLKSSKEYDIFKGQKANIKLKQPLEEGQSKHFQGIILGHDPLKGLKVKNIENNQEMMIKDENISSVQLKADFNK